jgi:ABC-type uncharacterized transport system substrate-binding protein
LGSFPDTESGALLASKPYSTILQIRDGTLKKTYLVVIMLLLLPICVRCAGASEESNRVLLIFSYNAEYPWVVEETLGVEEILGKREIKIEKLYMDTKRNTNAEWKAQVADYAAKEIDDFNPNVVIVFDDNACEFVAKRYIGETLPFVFCGMNGEPEDYGFPADNITGVIERHHLKDTIDLLKRLVPDATRVAIVTDNGPTSQAFVARAKKTILSIEVYEFYDTDDFDAGKAKVTELQSKVDAIGLAGYHTLRESGQQANVPGEDVLGWTVKNSKLPEFAVNEFTVSDGALCGVTLSGYEQGKAAAQMAIKILDGEKPADIPVTSPEKGKPIVNEGRAKELNIVISTDMLNEVEIVR